jgi:hypothetical protein
MTKRYGSLVGAVKQLTPTRPVDMAYENTRDMILCRDTILLAAAPANDTIQLAIVGWETILAPGSMIWFDALGAATTLSVGDITYPTALVNAQDTHTAAGNVNASKNLTIDKYFQPLWQALGYADLKTAQAVGAQCELLGKIGGGAATGNVTWNLSGHRRI